MRAYWKVNKKNLKYVKNITQEQINIWSTVCCEESYENPSQYIYISIIGNTNEKLGYMPYNKQSVDFYERIGCEYMGEINLKKDRRKKLKQINESNL